MIVRFRFADDEIEDHPLVNGIHFADYIRRVDVPRVEVRIFAARSTDPLPQR